jgi:hypothetical protein
VPTAETDHEVRRTLGAMHARMLEAVAGMSPEDAHVVLDCLSRMRAAVDAIEPAEEAGDEASARP